MNTEGQNQKTKYNVEILAGLFFLILIVWGCLSQLQTPLTCQQARETWQKQKINQGTSNSQSLEPMMFNRDTIHLCF
ncbi:MAG: hypothetical protein AB1589_02780 [Cyanobacteriota bacterium]